MMDVLEIGGHEYISAEALGRKFGVHRTTIQRWAKQHGLPFIKLGQTRMFELTKLVDWLDARSE